MKDPFLSTNKTKPDDIWAASDKQREAISAFGPPHPDVSRPVNMSQGVEAQARASRPAALPGAPDTSVSDRVAALAVSPAQDVFKAQPTSSQIDQALWSRPVPSGSPLGGTDSRPLTSRGGPMNYSRQGRGTNNPNAFAVGENRRSRTDRIIEKAALQGQPSAIAALARKDDSAWEDMLFNAPSPMPSKAPANPKVEAALWGQPANEDFWNDQAAKRADFWKEQNATETASTAADGKTPVDIFAMEGAGGYVPMVRNADGSTKAAGGFFPGAAPDPMALPLPPMSDEQKAQAIAAQARAQEQFFTGQGLKLQPPQAAKDAAGRTYAPPAPLPDQIAVNEDGKILKIPAGYQPPAGFTLLQKSESKEANSSPASTGALASGNSYKRVNSAASNARPQNAEPEWMNMPSGPERSYASSASWMNKTVK